MSNESTVTTYTKGEELFGKIFALIFLNVIFVGGAILQIGVLFHAKFADRWMNIPPITNFPLWAGAFLWVMFAMVSWVMIRQDRNVPSIVFAIIIHGVALASVAGIFSHDFLKFAHWANAILFTIFGMATMWWDAREFLFQKKKPTTS